MLPQQLVRSRQALWAPRPSQGEGGARPRNVGVADRRDSE